MSRLRSLNTLVLALVALAVAMRVLVPTGWMPSAEAGRIAITLCTEMGAVEAWIDADGTIKRGEPEKKSGNDAPCAFSGMVAAADLPSHLAMPALPATADAGQLPLPHHVAVGRGLVAPPPPSTGPPVLLI